MHIRRAVFAAAGGAAMAALTLGPLPVGAQEPLLPISVSPTSGPAGTTVTISGTECLSEGGPGDLEAYLFYGDGEPILVWSGTVAADGSWTASTVPEATDPPGIYTLSATCFASPDSDQIVADYDFVDFELTAAAPEAPADPAAPAAAPATPVTGQPRYTG